MSKAWKIMAKGMYCCMLIELLDSNMWWSTNLELRLCLGQVGDKSQQSSSNKCLQRSMSLVAGKIQSSESSIGSWNLSCASSHKMKV